MQVIQSRGKTEMITIPQSGHPRHEESGFTRPNRQCTANHQDSEFSNETRTNAASRQEMKKLS